MSSILHKELERGKAYEHEIGGHVAEGRKPGRKQIQKSGSMWIKLYWISPHKVLQLWSECDYSNWGTWMKIIPSHWLLKTKDSQVFFLANRPITFMNLRAVSWKLRSVQTVLKLSTVTFLNLEFYWSVCKNTWESFIFKKRCDWTLFFQVPRFE